MAFKKDLPGTKVLVRWRISCQILRYLPSAVLLRARAHNIIRCIIRWFSPTKIKSKRLRKKIFTIFLFVLKIMFTFAFTNEKRIKRKY